MLMFYRYALASLIALFIVTLTACSTIPQQTPAQVGEILRNSQVTVNTIAQPIALAERTKAQALGNMVVSSIVGSVAGSAGSANSAQAMQANMNIAQSFSRELNRALPDVCKVEAGKGADLLLAKKLSDYFAEKTKDSANETYIIYVKPLQWELAYISMLTSQDYALNYHFQIGINKIEEGQQKPFYGYNCAGSASDKMPLDVWKENTYAQVNKNAEVIVNQCVDNYLRTIGLQ